MDSRLRGRWSFCALAIWTVLAGSSGCAPIKTSLTPSNDRDWRADQAILPYAKFKDKEVKLYNVRNCSYSTPEDFIVRHYDKTYDLNKLRTVDFLVIPFPDSPDLAHTMLSFGFEPEDYVVISIEIRREKGEEYSPISGAETI